MIPNVLTIAGTDPTGGAGIQADLKTFSALGAYGMSAVTAVVAQNTRGVRGFVALEPDFVADQLAAVFEDVRVDAVKIGMVANAGIAGAIAQSLDRYAACPVVLDPVMVAKSGDHLLEPDAVDAVRDLLVPRSTVITPNLPEAAVLLGARQGQHAGGDGGFEGVAGMRAALEPLLALGAEWVLLKGGHLGAGGGDHTDAARAERTESTDLLFGEAGGEPVVQELTAPRITTTNDHGTGCTLSAAIAALITRCDTVTAARLAKEYLTAALRGSDELTVGGGHGPVHHFHTLWDEKPWRIAPGVLTTETEMAR